jgi:hypothetical protein
MSYFSSKSTWLSLVDGGQPARDPNALRLDGFHAAGPEGFALPRPDFVPVPDAADAEDGTPAGETAAPGDLDDLRITIELRHKLFFHFREWEFGPALFDDYLAMARAQSNPDEALAQYCLARHVAVTLVEKLGHEEYRLPWIETDRVIAEIHALIGNSDSAAVYANEGLKAIKNGRFGADHDMRITRLAVRFLRLRDGR